MILKYVSPYFKWAPSLISRISGINNGILLLFFAILAIAVANIPGTSDWYFKILEQPIFLGLKNGPNILSHSGHDMTIHGFINDGLMAIFFFLVGLELKREFVAGELASIKKAALPIIAAFGGMIMPVVVYAVLATISGDHNTPAFNGYAIPMATDIAFSLGVLTLLSPRVPRSLTLFLVTLAITDDLGGIVVIATLFTHFTSSSLLYFIASIGVIGILIALNQLKVYSIQVYMFFAFVLWWLFLQSGIHPTIAGVVVAMAVPLRRHISLTDSLLDIRMNSKALDYSLSDSHGEPIDDTNPCLLTHQQMKQAEYLNKATKNIITPLQKLEETLHFPVSYMIIPLFAFANAGVSFKGFSIDSLFQGVSFYVILALFVGKTVGIFSFAYLSTILKVAVLPKNLNWKIIFGVSMLGGIGFTVSLFIGQLSFGSHADLLTDAKIGVIVGSLISGVLGYLFLKKVLPQKKLQNVTKNDN